MRRKPRTIKKEIDMTRLEGYERVGIEKACGSLSERIIVSYSDLVSLFGEPEESDGCLVSGEWVLQDGHGEVVTIYDYKSTELYDEILPSVEEFRSYERQRFHIGSSKKEAAARFLDALTKVTSVEIYDPLSHWAF